MDGTTATLVPSVRPANPPIGGQTASARSGALVGGLIAMLIAIGVGLLTDFTVSQALGAVAPPAVFGGLVLGPSVRTDRFPFAPAMLISIFAVVLGSHLVAVQMIWPQDLVGEGPAGATGLATLMGAAGVVLSGTITLALIGLVLLGLPMLAVTMVCGLTWGLAVQHVTRRGWR